MGINGKIIIIASIIFIFAYNLHIYPWMMDDAFIFFRYAENFAAGEGFVYNPGERVEGCTSFLWMLILGAAALFKIDLLVFSKVLNALLACLIIILTAGSHKYIRCVTPEGAAAAAAITAACGAFAPWLSSGMEVVLFSFLILAAFFYSTGAETPVEYGASGVLCALVVMCRPEGIFLAIPIFVYHYITHLRRRDRGVYISIFKFIYVYAPYFLWRLWYYGGLMPNTARAKVGFGYSQAARGAEYFSDYFLLAAPVLIFAAAAGFYIFSGLKRNARDGAAGGDHYATGEASGDSKLAVLYAFVILNIIFVIAAGGDFMYGFRFFAHLTAPLAILAVFTLEKIFSARRYFMTAAIFVISYGLIQFFVHPEIYGISNSSPVDFGRGAGLFLKAEGRPDAVLAINTAGIIPYYSKLKTIDMLGLTDAHIASAAVENFGSGPAGHEKGDGGYVLQRRPDFIVFGNFEGSKTPIYRSDRQIFESAAFRSVYEAKVRRITAGVRRGGVDERFFHYFERKKDWPF
jgi:hypothetical protein